MVSNPLKHYQIKIYGGNLIDVYAEGYDIANDQIIFWRIKDESRRILARVSGGKWERIMDIDAMKEVLGEYEKEHQPQNKSTL